MEQAIARGDFLEYARVHTNMYGTSAKAVQDVSKSQVKIALRTGCLEAHFACLPHIYGTI